MNFVSFWSLDAYKGRCENWLSAASILSSRLQHTSIVKTMCPMSNMHHLDCIDGTVCILLSLNINCH